MKRNKLGIPISNNKDNIEGHSIEKYKYYNSNSILYYRAFKSIRPYNNIQYGIHIFKEYKHEKK